MKTIAAFLAALLTATGAGAFNDSGQTSLRHECPDTPPLIYVPPKCPYKAPCHGQISWGGMPSFVVHTLTFQEEGSLYNGLAQPGTNAVPQYQQYCQEDDGRFCGRLKVQILSHWDPSTDGLLTEPLNAYYEGFDDEVDYTGYGGVDFGRSVELIAFQINSSNTGRMIVRLAGECNTTVNGQLLQQFWERQFQVQVEGWSVVY